MNYASVVNVRNSLEDSLDQVTCLQISELLPQVEPLLYDCFQPPRPDIFHAEVKLFATLVHLNKTEN